MQAVYVYTRSATRMEFFSLMVLSLPPHALWCIFRRPISFAINEEKVTPTMHGPKRATVSLGEEQQLDGLVIATTVPVAGGEVQLVEARQLVDGGLAQAQVHASKACTAGFEPVFLLLASFPSSTCRLVMCSSVAVVVRVAIGYL